MASENSTLGDLCEILNNGPLLQTMSLPKLVDFVTYATALRSDILLTQPAGHDPRVPPSYLSEGHRKFLSEALSVEEPTVCLCWDVLKGMIWENKMAERLSRSPLEGFKTFGRPYGLTYHTFYPPSSYCTNPRCIHQAPLKSAKQREVIYFTLAQGPVPAHAVDLYCTVCHTNYSYNYIVHGGRRNYYDELPQAIEVGEHHFVEQRLINTWLLAMLFSWTSATNCARAYNETFISPSSPNKTTHGQPHFITSDFRFAPILRPAHVWDAVVILCLLEDCSKQKTTLDVSDQEDQDQRFRLAMHTRNIRLQRYGLGQTLHRCNKCVRFFDRRNDGCGILKTRVVVTDGITIGRPCCSVHNCKNPLQKQYDRFCADPEHARLVTVCAIKDCDSTVLSGHLVCGNRLHLEFEARHRLHGQARIRQLAQLYNPNDEEEHNDSSHNGEEFFDIDDHNQIVGEDIGPSTFPLTPAAGHKRVRAIFGRKRTHGEQLLVGCCGIIIARATMYGAEGIHSVAEFIKQVFRHVPPPEHIFYDSNCLLARHVRGKDPFFDNIGLSVDVFHFDCKHSEADAYCQAHCNPRSFPELLNDNGSWYFNSSAAEQVNSWIGKYQSMCREMTAEKFDFFLDEMIMRRNEYTLASLQSQGYSPTYWELNEL
ncbi:hypothetical protein BDY19DRAFT_978231 [Irpex rosettiformis]|uniref:Uncharacterized protein n=1 Tax=Irpex rosettiformis TaxID=378272 RepID=A0ACB8TNC3_9APHY|nr:hypothetical protein BDY19DRAFT_978231 [Irpex rosettiformis]